MLKKKVSVVMLFVLSSPGIAQDLTLEDISREVLMNASRVESGSCSYEVVSFRPKENILASHKTSWGEMIPPKRSLDHDLQLEGAGWFKWKANRYIGGEKQYVLGAEPSSGGIRIHIRESIVAYDGTCLRRLLRSLPTRHDPRSEIYVPMDEREESVLQLRGGIEKDSETLGSFPLFRELAFLSPPLLGDQGFYATHCRPEPVIEENLVVLEDRSGMGVYVLDPAKSFMRVEKRMGTAGKEGMVRRTSYEQKENGLWLPISAEEEVWENGNLRHRITYTLTSYEFNRDYPASDFEITFPLGTRVYDERTDEKFVVKSD